MTIANPRYSLLDGYPTLQVVVDGSPALLMAECKPAVHAAGLVFLGDEFADRLPAVELRPADGVPTTLRGFARDARLYRLYDAFLRDCGDGTFAEGPVAIPA